MGQDFTSDLWKEIEFKKIVQPLLDGIDIAPSD